MKKVLIIAIILINSLPISQSERGSPIYSEQYLEELRALQEWENIYTAIVIVESRGNPMAIGSMGDAGLLQILPEGKGGYLDEANRLVGYRKYRNEDRFCPVLTREMWEVVMLHHNPQKSLKKAIKMHNPRGGQKYADKVIREYNKLTWE